MNGNYPRDFGEWIGALIALVIGVAFLTALVFVLEWATR